MWLFGRKRNKKAAVPAEEVSREGSGTEYTPETEKGTEEAAGETAGAAQEQETAEAVSSPAQDSGEKPESGFAESSEEQACPDVQKAADVPGEESPAEVSAGTAEKIWEEEKASQEESFSLQNTEREAPFPQAAETAHTEELPEENADEETVPHGKKEVPPEETVRKVIPEEQLPRKEEAAAAPETDGETLTETAAPKTKTVSLYEWGRKNKKGKKGKKKKKAVPKKTVRLGQGERSVVLGEGMPKICVPITGRTLEEIVDQAANVASVFPDFVEWRVDYFEEIHPLEACPESGELPVNTVSSVFPAVDRALKKMADVLDGLPILFTIRTATEGGRIALYPEDYIGLLLHAAERPEVSAIDVEELRTDSDMEILTREIQARQKPVIGSAHFFGRMPKKPEQMELMNRISRTGADVLKLAAMPSDSRDVLKMMEMAEEENRLTDKPVIAIAMGKIGMVSRVSGALTGSCVTFGTVDAESAPGQIPVSTLRTILEALQG